MEYKESASSRRRFLQAFGRLGMAAAGVSLSPGATMAPAESPAPPKTASGTILVGSNRQLLFDDFFVSRGCAGPRCYGSTPQFADWLHGIEWRVGRAEKGPMPLLEADKPWETGVYWNCVIHDGGRYRMWYHSFNPATEYKSAYVCYAESDDGVHWHKPELNLIEWNGSKRNNIVYTGGFPDIWSTEFGNVFIDSAGKPEERYKMIYAAWEGGHPQAGQNGEVRGASGVLRGASSPDGIHWTTYAEKFEDFYPDSQNAATYDPVLGKYVAYIRSRTSYGALQVGNHPVAAEVRGRSVARIESPDFRHWNFPEAVLAPDFYDGLSVDLYNPGYSPYEASEYAHFMFPSAMEQYEGRVVVEVAVSRDNVQWLRPTREAFIATGEAGSFDSMGVYASPGMVPVDRDHYALYTRSDTTPHGGIHYKIGQVFPPKVGRAVFKRDRIIGIEAKAEGGFSTRPLIFDGRRLVVNVEPTGPESRLRVEVLSGKSEGPCPGYTFEDCVPLTGDELDGEVRWKSGENLGEWAGKPVRLRVQMRAMRLYAFQFVT